MDEIFSSIGDFLGDAASTIGDGISAGADWLFSSDTGKTILNVAGTALAGYALNEIANVNTTSTTTAASTTGTQVDPGVRLQADINPYNKIPVVYGKAVLSGSMTDVSMTSDNITMWYVFTLCEVTGKLDLGRGADSKISFLNVYWNDSLVKFNSNGHTVSGLEDALGNVSTDYAGLIDIYTFSGNSKTPVPPSSLTSAKNTKYAYQLIPEWIETDNMTNLVFAAVKMTYSKEKNLTVLGNLKFHLQNTMTAPGDCMYDYMTNTVYGARIPKESIRL